MNSIVCLKMVPDIVEDLEIASDGKSLDREMMRLLLSESDEHALEQSLLLKERCGGAVTAIATDTPETGEALFAALAKGVDHAYKITPEISELNGPTLAALMYSFLITHSALLTPDTLILAGAQAMDDLEGEMAPYLAELLGFPFLGVVTAISVETLPESARVVKEFAGGLRGEFEIKLPAVIGIQSAEKPPRYIPVAKVRAAMKTAKIESIEMTPPELKSRILIDQLYKPPEAGMAHMIEGSTDQVATEIVRLLTERGLA